LVSYILLSHVNVSPYGFALYLYERHIRKEGAIKSDIFYIR